MSVVDMQDRIKAWRQRVESAPQSRAFAPLADCLRQAGRHEEALALLEDGLVRHPDFTAALVILGQTLLDAGRSVQACKVLQTVLQRDAENVLALRLLAEEARSRDAWPEAIAALEKLVVLMPDDERWRSALVEVKANRRLTEPGEAPPTSFATMTLVEIYLAQGYLAKAMSALRQMLRREPGREDVQQKIAEIGILAVESSHDLPSDAAVRGDGSPVVAYQERKQVMAARRAAEKKNFEDWVSRIRSDEGAAP